MSQSPRLRFRDCAIAWVFALLFVSAPLAHADVTFNVTSEDDEADINGFDGMCKTLAGDCSLRAAIMQANDLTGPRTTHIILPPGHYTLTRPAVIFDDSVGDLNLKSPLSADQVVSIEGASAASSVIDADQIDRVMTIDQDRVAIISNVTIRGGYVTNTDAGGGGIKLDGTLTLKDSVVADNLGYAGGGIQVSARGRLDVLRTKFLSNEATTDGGAVYVLGETTFRETSMAENHSARGGAAFIAAAGSTSQGSAAFHETSMSGNQATDGGAIYLTTSLDLVNSTISGNAAARDGGGILNFGQSHIINSSISANSANANGGGVANHGSTWLYSTSIIANDASHDRNPPGGSGGGVFNQAGSRLVAINALIAGNTTLDSPIPDDCDGVLEVYGWNLLADDGGCSFSGNGIAARGQVSTNTIGPLADNGGPTWTHALLTGSEAINTTAAQGCIGPSGALLATDQRGAPRIAGSKCDVGAYEFGSIVPPADSLFKNGFD